MTDKATDELFNDVRTIMDTQLTETEVLVYLLMEGGYSEYTVADLPLGISRSTVRRIYSSARAKVERMADAGIFSTVVTDTKKR